MTESTKGNERRKLLPKLIWCPWHKTKVRSCVHRDKGLLPE